jgi:site-specific DNA-cytosine methylase
VTKQPIRALSLFSGIGAFEAALPHVPRRGKAPIEVVAHADIDPYVAAVYRYHFPDVPNLGDVSALGAAKKCPLAVPSRAKTYGRGGYDLLVAGFPCQDLSVGNEQGKGTRGKRSGLFWDAVRMLERDAPRYFLFENVVPRDRSEIDVISNALGVEPVLIDAATFTAQRRKRLFWCNWDVPALPKTRGPDLIDMLDPVGSVKSLAHSKKAIAYMSRPGGKGHEESRWHRGHQGDSAISKTPTLAKALHKGVPYNVLIDRRFKTPLVRRYSVTEVERIFGFPEGWTEYGDFETEDGDIKTREIAYSRRLGMLGNSISVPVLAHILKGLP